MGVADRRQQLALQLGVEDVEAIAAEDGERPPVERLLGAAARRAVRSRPRLAGTERSTTSPKSRIRPGPFRRARSSRPSMTRSKATGETMPFTTIDSTAWCGVQEHEVRAVEPALGERVRDGGRMARGRDDDARRAVGDPDCEEGRGGIHEIFVSSVDLDAVRSRSFARREELSPRISQQILTIRPIPPDSCGSRYTSAARGRCVSVPGARPSFP